MKCPNCGIDSSADAPECSACGLIFAKWIVRREARQAAASESIASPGSMFEWDGRMIAVAAAAGIIAGIVASHFRSWTPITEGWSTLETLWFPLSFTDEVFHEAGHWIFGVLGIQWLTVAGGTLMQLLLPSACLAHLWSRGSRAGVLAVLFWIGINFIEISWYSADAKLQALILTTGMSGREGGGHDWAWMLGRLGLVDDCVGIGQTFFFLGCWLMAFAPMYAAFRWRPVESKDAQL